MWSFMDPCGPSSRMRTFNPRSRFWTFMKVQNVDLGLRDQNLDLHEGPKYGPIYRDQNLDLYIGSKLWSYLGTKMWTYWGSMGNTLTDEMVPIEGPKYGPIIRDQLLVPILGPHWNGPYRRSKKWTHNQGPNFGPYSGTTFWTLDLGSKSWSLRGTIECVVP